ncbi:MAG: glycosyltransferase [Eubacterium sp.]
MRVLHMIPDIGVSNGVMSVILNYAKAMPDDIKFDVVYFSEKDKTRKSDIEALGGRVYKIDPPSPKDLITGKMNSFFSTHKNEWQVLHIHCPHFAIFIAPYAKKAEIKKIAVHCHTTSYSLKGNGKRNKILSLYGKYFIKDKFACSKEAGSIWYGNKAFRVLNNAVDCNSLRFNPQVRKDVRRQMDLENSFVVGHIGKTTVVQKNHPFLFQIFAEIKKKKENAVLLLAGGEETEELMSLAKKLGIDRDIRFLGVRNDIDKLLQAFDVFLFPSTSEGLPVSVIEAQAADLPVVMSENITNEVVVTDLVKIKSLNETAEVWADIVIELSNSERKDNFDKMKSAGWNISDTVTQLIEYYRR